MVGIYYKVANALAAVTLTTRSYTILDRLANAISSDAVSKAVYELGRAIDVIVRNPKEDQRIEQKEDKIIVVGKWKDKHEEFSLVGKLPEPAGRNPISLSASIPIPLTAFKLRAQNSLVLSKNMNG